MPSTERAHEPRRHRPSTTAVGSQKRWSLQSMQINDLIIFSANFIRNEWQKRWPFPT